MVTLEVIGMAVATGVGFGLGVKLFSGIDLVVMSILRRWWR